MGVVIVAAKPVGPKIVGLVAYFVERGPEARDAEGGGVGLDHRPRVTVARAHELHCPLRTAETGRADGPSHSEGTESGCPAINFRPAMRPSETASPA